MTEAANLRPRRLEALKIEICALGYAVNGNGMDPSTGGMEGAAKASSEAELNDPEAGTELRKEMRASFPARGWQELVAVLCELSCPPVA